MRKERRVNRLEAFRPSEKSKIIIEALIEKFNKNTIYNMCIEAIGSHIAFSELTKTQFYNMVQELDRLELKNLNTETK